MAARKIVASPAFERSYKKFTKRNQLLIDSIAKALKLLEHMTKFINYVRKNNRVRI